MEVPEGLEADEAPQLDENGEMMDQYGEEDEENMLEIDEH